MKINLMKSLQAFWLIGIFICIMLIGTYLNTLPNPYEKEIEIDQTDIDLQTIRKLTMKIYDDPSLTPKTRKLVYEMLRDVDRAIEIWRSLDDNNK